MRFIRLTESGHSGGTVQVMLHWVQAWYRKADTLYIIVNGAELEVADKSGFAFATLDYAMLHHPAAPTPDVTAMVRAALEQELAR